MLTDSERHDMFRQIMKAMLFPTEELPGPSIPALLRRKMRLTVDLTVTGWGQDAYSKAPDRNWITVEINGNECDIPLTDLHGVEIL
jgi:hypothetical protein